GVVHRRYNPRESLFQHIICCPNFECFNRHLFAERSRNKDEWDIRTLFQSDFQGRKAVEGGQGIIGKDEVKATLLESSAEISLRFHTYDMTENTFGLKSCLKKFCVPGVIFKMENTQRRWHNGFLWQCSTQSRYLFLMLPGGGSLITAQKIPSSLTALINSWKSTGLTTYAFTSSL